MTQGCESALGGREAGSPDGMLCFGEGKVPVFEDQDGLPTPVGYRPCGCVEEE